MEIIREVEKAIPVIIGWVEIIYKWLEDIEHIIISKKELAIIGIKGLLENPSFQIIIIIIGLFLFRLFCNKIIKR